MSEDPDRYAVLKDPNAEDKSYSPPVRRDVHYGERTGEADGQSLPERDAAANAKLKAIHEWKERRDEEAKRKAVELPRSIALEKLAAEHKEIVSKREDTPQRRDHEQPRVESKPQEVEATHKGEMTDARQARTSKDHRRDLREMFDRVEREIDGERQRGNEVTRSPSGRGR